ncbi:MAG: class I SAM-dependent methyltransferase [Thermodesulfobacteriota bacterium]|jgi:ubiquinone/menaquinone biosynthesis C-methylase UbiE
MVGEKKNSRTYKRFDSTRAKEYAEIANQVFAPIYPVIARQIMDRCKIGKGLCIDIGTGPANLAIALAKITDLKTFAMDHSWLIFSMAKVNIEVAGLSGRIILVVGDVHRMPFQDNIVSLVISRGSMRFWRNKPAAFREIHRVLLPGGKGYVGGGMGSSQLGEEINQGMVKWGKQWKKGPSNKYKKKDVAYFHEILRKAGFVHYEIILDDSGFWVYVEKEE